MAAATAQRAPRRPHPHRARRAPAAPRIRPPYRPPPARVPAPRPGTGVFERLRGLPDHRVIDRLLRGRAWICFVGVALMGIVAMQVSLLKLNAGISRAVETTATLERQNSRWRRASPGSPPASASARPPTSGMVMPAAGDVHYLRARAGGRPPRRPPHARAEQRRARPVANGGRVPGALRRRAGDHDHDDRAAPPPPRGRAPRRRPGGHTGAGARGGHAGPPADPAGPDAGGTTRRPHPAAG